MNNKDLKILFNNIELETKKAVLYRFGKRDIKWIPKSQIKDVNLLDGFLTLPDWIVRAKKLEKYVW